MSYRNHPLGRMLLGVDNCPHCGRACPLLSMVWHSEGLTVRSDGSMSSQWATYLCTSCGGAITAKGLTGSSGTNPPVEKIFPDVWEASIILPEQVRNYLQQAYNTLGNPDASVVMSAASIDAILKDKGLKDGSLYKRIDEAFRQGLLTQIMADWAHRVRLDSNNPRHADNINPHMSAEDAKRAFDYANALAEYLYILPSRMPPEQEEKED